MLVDRDNSSTLLAGMVGGMLRHMRSLRTMKRDHGRIHTLLEEVCLSDVFVVCHGSMHHQLGLHGAGRHQS